MSHGKYRPLFDYLADAARRGEDSMQLTFSDVEGLIGELPRSARTYREWWANGGHTQAEAWMDAGWVVSLVSTTGENVRFERQTAAAAAGTPRSIRAAVLPKAPRAEIDAMSLPVIGTTDLRVTLDWRDAGLISLDGAGSVLFPRLPARPGLYQMTFTSPEKPSARVYIGETDDLRRRAAHYRNPGATQATNIRLNGALGSLLSAGGVARLSIAVDAQVHDTAKRSSSPLDLSRKASRLLAENAALVMAQMAGNVEIENLE